MKIFLVLFLAAFASLATAQASPDGTASPPAPFVVDSFGVVWTVSTDNSVGGANFRIVSNGSDWTPGYGSGNLLLWKGGVLYMRNDSLGSISWFHLDGQSWQWNDNPFVSP